jgi:hypothetical protein
MTVDATGTIRFQIMTVFENPIGGCHRTEQPTLIHKFRYS